jgi:hypothetical protein
MTDTDRCDALSIRTYQIEIQPVDVRREEADRGEADARGHEDERGHEDADVQQEGTPQGPGMMLHEEEPEEAARSDERVVDDRHQSVEVRLPLSPKPPWDAGRRPGLLHIPDDLCNSHWPIIRAGTDRDNSGSSG